MSVHTMFSPTWHLVPCDPEANSDWLVGVCNSLVTLVTPTTLMSMTQATGSSCSMKGMDST